VPQRLLSKLFPATQGCAHSTMRTCKSRNILNPTAIPIFRIERATMVAVKHGNGLMASRPCICICSRVALGEVRPVGHDSSIFALERANAS
jgi:hypothetical protein